MVGSVEVDVDKVRQLWSSQEKAIESLSSSRLGKFKSAKSQWWDKDFPKGQEFWKYVRFNDLSQVDWQLPKDQSVANKLVVSKDKIAMEIHNFSSKASLEREGELPKGLSIHSIQEVLQSSELFEKYSHKIFKEGEKGFFENINASFMTSGFVVAVSKNTVFQPLQLSIRYQGDNEFINPRFLFVAESGVQGQISLEISLEGSQFFNLSKDFYLDENAHLKVFNKEQGGAQSYILDNTNLYLQKSANCQFFDMTLPSKWTRHNLVSHLRGEGAEARLVGSYLNEKDYFCDHHTIINHEKPSTFSHQNYKGILADNCRATFNGRVYVAPGASKSNSEQLNKNLLLSEKAEINTKPELQIYNDDVKAAHGATVGQLDKEQLFYLQSRGIKKESAWQLLSEAFVYDLFEDLNDEDRAFFTNSLEKTLTGFQGVSDGL